MGKNRAMRQLRIDRICIYRYNIRLARPFRIATMMADHAPNVLVRIGTSDGLEGWGEASPLHSIVGETQRTDLAAALEIRELLMGCDPLALVDRTDEMDRFLPHNTTIKGAFDIAMHDIAAKAAGMPLWQFLGGSLRDLQTDLTVGINEPEVMAQRAGEAVEQQFRFIKLKLGEDPSKDIQRVQAVRHAVGEPIGLRLDANQGWDRVSAVQALRGVEDCRPQFCEQPVRAHDLAGMRWVGERTSVPLVADESLFGPQDALRIAAEGAAPMLNIKLSKSGGIRRAAQVAAVAEAAGLVCMMGCMLESRLALTAAAHFACSAPVIRHFDLDSYIGQVDDPVIGGAYVERGMVKFTDGPGLGLEMDEGFVSKLEVIA